MRAMSNCSAWNMLKRMGVEAADEFIKKPSVAAELNRDLRLPLLLSDNERWPERPDVKLHLIMQTFLLKPQPQTFITAHSVAVKIYRFKIFTKNAFMLKEFWRKMKFDILG